MKQLMIDMMAAMMPFLKTPVLVAAGLAVIGLIILMMKLFTGRGPGLGLVAWILIALGGTYIIFQLMGLYLGMGPTVNFGDPTKFEFNTVEFWKLGVAMLIPGFIYLIAAKRR